MSNQSNHRTSGGTGHTPWDLVIGGILVVLGFVILGEAVIATTVSLLFVGWMILIGGIVTLVGSLFQIGKGGFWIAALGGGLMTALGLMFLRHTDAAAVTLTLIAGTLFLMSGLARLAAAFGSPEARVALIFSGAVSTILGLLVLFNIWAASATLIGILLGIQVITEGLAIMIVGRAGLRSARSGLAGPAASAT